MGRVIGKIVEVSGLSVKAKLFELLPPYLVSGTERESAPKINGFVKTRIGLDVAVCQVVGEYNEDGEDSYFLKLEVKGYFQKDEFIQGLRVLPIVSANIELMDKDDYSRMFSSRTETTICLGNDLYDDNKGVNVEINKLIPSHIGVFGNTGSGKSNTVTKILSSYYEILNKQNKSAGKFLIIDLNNEYGSSAVCEEENKIIYKLSTGKKESLNKIPLSLDDFDEDDFIVLMNASQKTQAPVVKTAFHNIKATDNSEDDEDQKTRNEDYYKKHLKNILNNSKRQLFFSMRLYLGEYFENIDCFKYHSQQSSFYYQDPETGIRTYSNEESFNRYLNNIKIKLPSDKLDRFLFELYFAVAHEYENGVGLDFMMPLISRARKLITDFRKVFDFGKDFKTIFKGKKVCVIQLASVNRDMKEIIPSIIANNIFKILQSKKEEIDDIIQVINIVVDEAHNILYDDNKDILNHKGVLEVFERVIKEGRKFGLYLMLASQRPSDISPTIISQLHNYFIHKLVNPSDIAMIRKAVAYMDERSLDFITIMAPGECIVSGTAFQMPAFIRISQVSLETRPRSENVVLVGDNGLFSERDGLIDHL